MAIAPETRMGPVELSVADLERSLDYWQRTVGLRVLERENGTASLGTDLELLLPHPARRSAASATGMRKKIFEFIEIAPFAAVLLTLPGALRV